MRKNIRFISWQFIILMIAMFVLQISAKASVARGYDDSTVLFSRNENPLTVTKLVTCYPNPATTYINFKFDNGVPLFSTLSIYSFTGRKMGQLKVTDRNVIRISLDDYYRGLYMYQLCDASGNILESGRFIVKN